MAKENTIALRESIDVKVDGATVKLSEVKLRRPKGRDMLIFDKHRGEKGEDAGFAMVIATVAAVTGLTFDEASDMDAEDLVEISEQAVDFFPKGKSPDQPEG